MTLKPLLDHVPSPDNKALRDAMLRRIEKDFWQNKPIGHHDNGVRPKPGEVLLLFHIFQGCGGKHGQAGMLRESMYRREPLFLPPAGRTGRLGVNTRHLMARAQQFRQAGHGEIGRSHEDDAKRHVSCRPLVESISRNAESRIS